MNLENLKRKEVKRMITIRKILKVQQLDKTPLLLPEIKMSEIEEIKIMDIGVILIGASKRQFVNESNIEEGIHIVSRELKITSLMGEYNNVPREKFPEYIAKYIRKHDLPISQSNLYTIGSTLVLFSHRSKNNIDILILPQE